MDKIELTGMQFYGYHGVFAEERKLGQRFYVDLVLYADLRAAGQTDALERTVNYAEVYQTVKDVVEGESVQLVEALAERIASRVLDTYTIVNELTVRVTKPHPPVDMKFAGMTVEMRRKKDER
ncbi:dihydroneopterin aldolase [Xylanibacillus composti]|uniref:7,8-dihydroneopterin aldolase n=1 Tax=Xylanibacillus composti TaxID=1572762 RepID=A0A8J4LZZ2_9BACL|nr:dihydroneopterin aldolase [Xylanibacillus composti]MDT9725107.1 dihydroneopterin aldolase [Xylanibacillus composti]GIQ67320.1 dihydroneopterin aldolase [Xylanibacillus composti]